MFKKLLILAYLILMSIFIVSCNKEKDFDYGLDLISALNAKYNSTVNTPPKTFGEIGKLSKELSELKNLKLAHGQKPFELVLDYRLYDLEAIRLYTESEEKYGSKGSTKLGFGCKRRPSIVASSALRNMSAQKGFIAAEIMDELISKYPLEAEKANITQKNKLFLNATYYAIQKDAKRDRSIIDRFCPENQTVQSTGE